MQNDIKTVLVTGGAGYVGAILVPKLLSRGYSVKVLDLYLYEPDIFAQYRANKLLEEIKGDLRNKDTLKAAFKNADAVIHLACISNDPSFELNPELGKSINYDGMIKVVEVARDAGIKRFIYASSSSVYGIKGNENVTEDLPLEPLTDYSKYKISGEEILMEMGAPHFTSVAIRLATVCGYSPRMRFDVVVNILTNHAWNNGIISVLGGYQKRPNIHIQDITDLYVKLLEYPSEKIHKKIYNIGTHNYRVSEIADIVKNVVQEENGKPVNVVFKDIGDDNRSYHISSDKIKSELGFTTKFTVADAVRDVCRAFRENKFSDSLNNIKYFNVKLMQSINLR